MITRKIFEWECQLLGDNGTTLTQRFKAFWSPDRVSTDSIALACAAMETVKAKQTPRYAGSAATLVTAAD